MRVMAGESEEISVTVMAASRNRLPGGENYSAAQIIESITKIITRSPV